MAIELSKTQLDRLGDRLKKGAISEDDLRLLDQYRRSFSDAYEVVVETLRKELALEPTGRPAKSTISISDKLCRESIRLTQIQDIAGCRLIVPDIAAQESLIQALKSVFERTIIIDRREKPSHGYRAVHAVVNSGNKIIEIQVRTSVQQLWAELSEKFSDVEDPAIKYGGGDPAVQATLTETSELVARQESLETRFADAAARLSSRSDLMENTKQEIDSIKDGINTLRQGILKLLRETIESVEK